MAEVEENGVNVAESETQFVSFLLGKERYAFAMHTVGEIIRVPSMVKVPLGPAQMLGLANLRGNVLPVYDLQMVLVGEYATHSDSSRVVVVESSIGVTGFLVDRVARVHSVPSDCVEKDQAWENAIAYEYLEGLIKEKNQPIEQILNAESLVAAQLLVDPTAVQQQISLAARQVAQVVEDEEDENEYQQLVCFSISNQEFSFHLQDVEEIVRVPDDISALPDVHPSVIGLVNLRGRIIPIVDLAMNLGMASCEINDASRIVIVNSAHSTIGSVGFVVAKVSNVVSISPKVMEPVPAMCNSGQGEGTLQAVFRMEQQKRLISIVNLSTIFQRSLNSAIEHIEELSAEELTMSTEHENNFEEEASCQYVIFWIDGQEYGVSIDDTQEITRVPAKLESVPNTPAYLRGIVNLRGTVLPVIDLRTRLGLDIAPESERQRIIVLTRNEQKTGFIVDGVAEVKTVEQKVIETAPSLSEEQKQLLSELIKLNDEGRIIQLLDPNILLADKHLTTAMG